MLLTATIDPGSTIMVSRRDPLVRLRDYQDALRVWARSSVGCKIVFCENSSYDLSSVADLTKQFGLSDVEFLSFSGNESGAIKGKGHAELAIIKHAFETSRHISTAHAVIKCTGRLTVRNSKQLFDAILASDFDVMCTLKRQLSFADSRLFVGTPGFFRDYLFPLAETIDDAAGITFEHALACGVGAAIGNRMRWRPFPIFPLIEGISGTNGLVMTNPLIKATLKRVYHRLRNFVYIH